MSILTKSSLIVTPNAVKASKLYSVIPSNGNGDMTVVRATTATRVNSLGLIESVAANVPRLNYDSVVGCPSILVEPQRTNLLLNSVWAGGGSLPTSWTFATNTGTTTPVTSIKNPNVTAYKFVTSNTRQEFGQNFSLILNQVTAFSCYVESVVTPIPLSFMLRIGLLSTANGTAIYLKNNIPVLSNSIIEAGNTYSIVFTCTVAGSFTARIGAGCDGNITADITLSMPQVELGTGSPSITSYSTSFIPTTIQTITRNTDVITRSNIYTNNLITSAGGTWFIELNNNLSLTRDVPAGGMSLKTSSTSFLLGFNIRTSVGSNRLFIGKRINNIETTLYTTLTNTVKIAIDWNGTTADVFVNGVKVVTGTSFVGTIMEFITLEAEDVPKYIKSMMLFPRPLTDAEMIQLTTL